jgi:voltage-gated potassium channel
MARGKLWSVVLGLLLAWAILVVLLAAVERGHEDSSIRSIGDAAWYSLVTMTTVGYGDKYPATTAGKVIGMGFLLASLGVLGVLVYRVSTHISEIRERRKMGLNGTRFERHVVILGWDDFARAVTRQLVNADVRVAIVTDKKDDVDWVREQFPKEQVFVLFADLSDISLLEKAGIERAGMVFPNLVSDTDKLIAVLNIRKEYPDAQFVVTLDSADLKDTFRAAGVAFILAQGEIAAKIVASYIFEPDVAEYEVDLMSSATAEAEYDIQQFRVGEGSPFLGREYGFAFSELKSRHNVVLIGLARHKDGERELMKLPDDDVAIERGDHLVVIVSGKTEKVVAELFGTVEGVL